MSAAPMSMNRVIHGAVRRDLARLTAALGRAPDGAGPQAQQLQRAFGNLHEQLRRHHEGEDAYVWPMLAGAGVDGELLQQMEAEHQEMSAALDDSERAMAAFARSAAGPDAAAARDSLERTASVVERHLRHEEDELEPVLAPHLESAEWKAVEKKLSRQPPRVAGRFMAWVGDGMQPAERAYFRATVPPPVTYLLAHTFGRSYYREVAPVWRA